MSETSKSKAGFDFDINRAKFAVVFASKRTAGDAADYATAANRMVELATSIPGYVGIYSARGDQSWTDVSSWYWQALLGKTHGPWWAVTVTEKIPSK